MRRALLFCAAIVFAIACGDNITEPIPERTKAVSVPVSFATTTTEDGLSISTDKDDYAPGDTVWFTGAGWPADDVLDILLEDDPATHEPHTWTVAVGADGTFRDSTYVVDVDDVGVTFTLTATSRATRRSLIVYFTDGTISAATIAMRDGATCATAQSTVAAGSPICAHASFTVSGSGATKAQFRWRNPSGTVVAMTQKTPDFPNGTSGTQNFDATFTPTVAGTWTVLLCESDNSDLTLARCQGSTAANAEGATHRASQTFTVTPGATKLAFTTQPGGGEPNTSFPTQPVVEVQNASGSRVTGSTASVTLTIVSGTGTSGAVLSCTNNPINAVAGVASFVDCKIDLAGTGYKLQASSSGLTSAESDAFNVIVPNQPPVANDDAYSTNEDTPLSVAAANGVLKNDTDPNGDALTAVLVSGPDPAKTTAFSLAANGSFSFTPAANFYGDVTFTYRANDGTVNSASPATVTITVNPVNDAPSFTKGDDQTVNEDAGPQTVNGWATNISAGPNEASQTVSFIVTNGNAALFSAAPAVASNGTLTYTPAPDANGTATVSVKAKDDGGTTNGGVDESGPQTFTITVMAVNDAPSFTKGANQAANEGAGAQTVTGWATNISAGPPDESGQTLTFEVTGNTNPSIFSVAPAIASTNGTLTYTPSLGPNGTSTITVRLKDNGGTANGGVDVSATQTFDITVNNVAPAIGTLTDQSNVDLPDPVTVVIAGTLSFKVPFTDPGTADNHTAEVDCGSGYSAVNGGATVTSGFTASCQFNSGIGPKVISVRVTDDHDSDVMTQNVLVVYNFSGFFAPVDRPNTMNVSKVGQAIPLKWRLTDALGRPITDVTSVSVQAVNFSCGLTVTTDQVEEYASGSSGLQNLGDGYYQFNWKTPAAYLNSCKSITLVFGAGSGYTEKPSAYFTFKK